MHHYCVSYIKAIDKVQVGQSSCDIQTRYKIKRSAEIWEEILRDHNSKYEENITGISIISINYLGEFEEE